MGVLTTVRTFLIFLLPLSYVCTMSATVELSLRPANSTSRAQPQSVRLHANTHTHTHARTHSHAHILSKQNVRMSHNHLRIIFLHACTRMYVCMDGWMCLLDLLHQVPRSLIRWVGRRRRYGISAVCAVYEDLQRLPGPPTRRADDVGCRTAPRDAWTAAARVLRVLPPGRHIG